ncbi:MarR family winged helix-turn-helix transcriptional regulator [Pseudoglutamicibacter albus]|uniref:MarR family winged helix-turn-helix transcriptional regulator n=1 Tax=Pseudoglutamicibacter albus TaxID=98671 RepID=UPI00068E399C|nr:MarR family transcriptional regulator [Pseudoglutamicibacter albus]
MSDACSEEFTEQLRSLTREYRILLAAARRSFREQAAALDASLQPFDGVVASALYRRFMETGSCTPDAGMTVTELSEIVDADKSMVSRAIKRLETAELLVRTADPKDARSYLLVLSDSARARFKDYVMKRQQESAVMFEDWSIEEVSRLAALLKKLNDSRTRMQGREAL